MCLQFFSCPAEALVNGVPAQTVAGGNGACVLKKEISAQENIGIPLWQRIQKRGNGPGQFLCLQYGSRVLPCPYAFFQLLQHQRQRPAADRFRIIFMLLHLPF